MHLKISKVIKVEGSQNLQKIPVERNFYLFIKSKGYKEVEARLTTIQTGRSTSAVVKYYLDGKELTDGLLIYDRDSPAPIPDHIFIPSLEEFEKVKNVFQELKRMEAEKIEREKKQEAEEIKELLRKFKEYCVENELLAKTFDPNSLVDYIIYKMSPIDELNNRIKQIINKFKWGVLFSLPLDKREEILNELEKNAKYIEINFNHKELSHPKLIPLEVLEGRNGEIIGRERDVTYILMLMHVIPEPTSKRLAKMIAHMKGKIAIFKCSPPKLFENNRYVQENKFVLATKYVEKENVIIVYEWIRINLQELIQKREYLKNLEKTLPKRR